MTTPQQAVPLDQPLYGATFVQAIQRFFTKYAVFSGRASRSEFWWVSLALGLVTLVLYLLTLVLGIATGSQGTTSTGSPTTIPGAGAFLPGALLVILWLGTIVPGIAVTVRRLHDANFSGLLYLIVLVPYVGSLILLIFTIMGPNPAGARFDLGAQPYVPQPQPGVQPYGGQPYAGGPAQYGQTPPPPPPPPAPPAPPAAS